MKNETFDFHGSKFTIKVLTSETNGNFTVLDVIHPPNLGPGTHIHPRGSETFYIVEGDYEFILDGKSIMELFESKIITNPFFFFTFSLN